MGRIAHGKQPCHSKCFHRGTQLGDGGIQSRFVNRLQLFARRIMAAPQAYQRAAFHAFQT